MQSILPPPLCPDKHQTKSPKKQVTLRLSVDAIEYVKALAEETGVPYQNLINLYLRECAHTCKKPALS
jgi:predicted DNA binding CopG/RHH family protein